jgi:hypothetical protein
MLVLLCLSAASFIIGAPASAARTTAPLEVSRLQRQIAVKNATPGATVLLVAHEQEVEYSSTIYTRSHYRATADEEGHANFILNRDAVQESLWVAIDTSTGSYGAVTGDGSLVRSGELAGSAIGKDNNGKNKKILAEFDYVYVLAVRPGLEEWEVTSADGGPFDDDGEANGRIRIDVNSAKTRSKHDTPLDEVKKGDVIFVFIPHQTAFLVYEVTK